MSRELWTVLKTARPAAAMGALLAAGLLLGGPAAARAQSGETGFLAPGAAAWIETAAHASTFSSSWHALSYHRMFGLVGQPLTQSEVNRIHRDFPQDQAFLVEGEVVRESLTGPITFDGRTPASGWGDTIAPLGDRADFGLALRLGYR